MPEPASASRPIPSPVRGYLDSIGEMCTAEATSVVSVVAFGSAVTGGWVDGVSDVDLIVVMRDECTHNDRDRVSVSVHRIETLHSAGHHSPKHRGVLERVLDKIIGAGSFFLCTRADLLSGSIGRILGLAHAQEVFVDRIVLANIISSGLTIWGVDLLPQVPVAPVRRIDVLKALFGLIGQAWTAAALYPLLPHATRYSMEALKRSLHSCFFCYQQRRGSLEEEAAFFQALLGPNPTLAQLVALRREYRESFAFVLRCLPTLVALHYRTFIDKPFAR